MKAKITRGSSAEGLAKYLLGKGKEAKLIGGNVAGQTPNTIAASFAAVAAGRSEVGKPVWHCSLSLPEGENLTDPEWNAVAARFLEEMGIDADNHQFVLVRHSDTDHDHVHLMVNRVGYNGELFYGKRDVFRAIEATQKLEQEFGLTQTVGLDGRARTKPKWQREFLGQAQERAEAALAAAAGGTLIDFEKAARAEGLNIEWTNKNRRAGFRVAAEFEGGKILHFKARDLFGKAGMVALAGAGISFDREVDKINFAWTDDIETYAARDLIADTFSKDSAVSRGDLIDAFSAITDHPAELIDKHLKSGALLTVGEDHVTTPRIMAAEEAAIETARQMVQGAGYSAAYSVSGGTHHPLSAEQGHAFDHALDNQLSIIQGSAGAGKTHTLRAIADNVRDQGGTVIGGALAKRMAEDLGEGIGADSYTIASLLPRLEDGRIKIDHKSVLMIDEAAQLGSSQMARLLKVAEARHARVILAGEDRQLDAINHGGMFRYLARHVVDPLNITTIRRQSEQWARDAAADLRDGNAQAALNAFAARGLTHIGADADAARGLMVRNYFEIMDKRPEAPPVMLAHSNAEAQELGDYVRAELQRRGIVAAGGTTYACIHGEDSATDDARRYDMELAAGDRVRFTKNDNDRGTVNGQFGTVVQALDGQLQVRSDNGALVNYAANDFDEERLPLGPAYAMTIYGSQGMTAPGDVLVSASTGMDRALAYVAGSRARDNTHWFFDNEMVSAVGGNAGLFARYSADNYRKLAHDHLLTPERNHQVEWREGLEFDRIEAEYEQQRDQYAADMGWDDESSHDYQPEPEREQEPTRPAPSTWKPPSPF